MITLVYGLPRSGKTCFEAKCVADNYRKLKIRSKIPGRFFKRVYSRLFHVYECVYCTDPSIKGTIPIDYKHFGLWCPRDNSLVILAEAGVGASNRAWKSLSGEFKRLIALHGHHNIDILCDSQTVDIDAVIRARTARLFVCRKFLCWSVLRRISYRIGVIKETATLGEVYVELSGLRFFFSLLFGISKIFKRKKYYRWFDSWADDFQYPEKAPENVSALPPRGRVNKHKLF